MPGTGSVVVLVTVAVLLMTVPSKTFVFTFATMVSVAEVQAARVPMVQAGDVQLPADWPALIKVSPAGRLSVAVTPSASLVPLFVTTIV